MKTSSGAVQSFSELLSGLSLDSNFEACVNDKLNTGDNDYRMQEAIKRYTKIAEFTGEDNPESRYLRQWTDSYDLHRATGDSSEYVGFGPNGRLSGSEGLTLHPTSSDFHLDVILQQVVVQ